MADYPNIPQVIGSQFVGDDGTVLERAVSGRPRLRSFYTQPRFLGQVMHDVDDPEKLLVENHYNTHRGVPFNVLFRGDGRTYQCYYVGMPEFVPLPGVGRWRILTKLVQV